MRMDEATPAAVAPEAIVARAGRPSVTVLIVLICIWVFGWYWDTLRAMARIWHGSQTFTHGYVVLPIFAWLLWRSRHELDRLDPQPSGVGLALVALAGFAWLLGDLAGVAAVSQLAMVGLVAAGVLALCGWAVTRRLAFPLVFLFFAVPVGEFMLPALMDWTADFVVVALQASGIPVYSEGRNFVIPSGSWSVVEACSGVRYLIASLMVGTLYAYLTYQSNRRRLAFVAVSAVVPVVANWLRAYMIVMLGHLSGNRLAVGVDHLIYGWFFFGIVMLLMFWIGGRWSEPEPVHAASAPPTAAKGDARRLHGPAVLVLGFALLALARPAQWALEAMQPGGPLRLDAIDTPAGWQAPAPFTDWSPIYPQAPVKLDASFEHGGRRAGMFIAGYSQQTQGRELIAWNNKLVESTGSEWVFVRSHQRRIDAGGISLPVLESELRGPDQRLLVWQWYWVNGRVTASEHLAKAWLALDKLLGRGDYSAALIVYAPYDIRKVEAEPVLKELVQGLAPLMHRRLAAASGAAASGGE